MINFAAWGVVFIVMYSAVSKKVGYLLDIKATLGQFVLWDCVLLSELFHILNIINYVRHFQTLFLASCQKKPT